LPEAAVLPQEKQERSAEPISPEHQEKRDSAMNKPGGLGPELTPPVAGSTGVPSAPVSQQPGAVLFQSKTGAALQRPKSTKRVLFVSAVVFFFAVAGILGWYFLWSASARIIRLAEAGQLVAPAGASAYDLYLGTKDGIGRGVTRRRLKGKVIPKLLQAGVELLKNRYEAIEFKRPELEQLFRIYDWAADLSPEDAALSARRAYAAGLRAFQRESYQEAISHFREAILKDPKWPLPLNDIGRAYVRVGDNGNAEQFYQQALQVDPSWVFPQLNLAGVYLHGKRLTEAEAGYRRAAEMDSTLATPWYFIGEIYRAQGRDSDAIGAYGRAVTLAMSRPSSAFSVDRLKGRIQQMQKGRPGQADSYYPNTAGGQNVTGYNEEARKAAWQYWHQYWLQCGSTYQNGGIIGGYSAQRQDPHQSPGAQALLMQEPLAQASKNLRITLEPGKPENPGGLSPIRWSGSVIYQYDVRTYSRYAETWYDPQWRTAYAKANLKVWRGGRFDIDFPRGNPWQGLRRFDDCTSQIPVRFRTVE